MVNWKCVNSCRPDVVYSDAPDVPSPCCGSCGDPLKVDGNNQQPNVTGITSESRLEAKLELCWPSTLNFVEDSSDGISQTTLDSAMFAGRAKITASQSSGPYNILQGGEIRLLELLPGNYDNPIKVILRTQERGSWATYEALSYTWADPNGDKIRRRKIYVGDDGGSMIVTNNCANALRRLRSPNHNQSRMLWVDAICINQENVDEKSHQVGMMQYIYANASRVLIYLGEDPDEPSPRVFTPWMYENQGNTLDLQTDLSSRPYFKRTWVFQEIASARVAWVLFGSRGALLPDFLAVPRLVGTNSTVNEAERRTNVMACNRQLLIQSHFWLHYAIQRKKWSLRELPELLNTTAGCRVSDTRDKVFALLGLVNEAKAVGLVADYSLSRNQVFSGLTAFIIQQYPEMLGTVFANVATASSSGLPSWAIDWSTAKPWTGGGFRTALPEQFDLYQEHLPEKRSHIRLHRNGILILKGSFVVGLRHCIVGNMWADRAPGAITNIRYEPDFPECQRESSFEVNSRVRMTDMVFVIAALPNNLMILQPLAEKGRYSFIALCDPPTTESTAKIFQAVDQEVILLFSAWNQILSAKRSHPWFDPRLWGLIKHACRLIKDHRHWRTQDSTTRFPEVMMSRTGSLPEFRDEIRRVWKAGFRSPGVYHPEEVPRDVRFHLPGDGEESFLPALLPQADWTQFLVQACWELRGDRNTSGEATSPGAPVGHGNGDGKLAWHSDFLKDPPVVRLQESLGRFLFGKPLQCLSHYGIDEDGFLACILTQNLKYRSRVLEALLEKDGKSGGNHALWLDGKAESAADDESVRMAQWLRGCFDFDTPPERASWRSRAPKMTWAAAFREVFSALVQDPAAQPPSRKRKRSSAGGQWQQEEVWDILHELMLKTEERLLPMQHLFSRGKWSEKMQIPLENREWEDLYIV